MALCNLHPLHPGTHSQAARPGPAPSGGASRKSCRMRCCRHRGRVADKAAPGDQARPVRPTRARPPERTHARPPASPHAPLVSGLPSGAHIACWPPTAAQRPCTGGRGAAGPAQRLHDMSAPPDTANQRGGRQPRAAHPQPDVRRAAVARHHLHALGALDREQLLARHAPRLRHAAARRLAPAARPPAVPRRACTGFVVRQQGGGWDVEAVAAPARDGEGGRAGGT